MVSTCTPFRSPKIRRLAHRYYRATQKRFRPKLIDDSEDTLKALVPAMTDSVLFIPKDYTAPAAISIVALTPLD